LYLLVGLIPGDGGVELQSAQLRHPQPQPATQLGDDDLGDERLATLSGTAELRHIGTEVLGLDDPRQRAAFTKRRHVPDDLHSGEHLSRLAGRAGPPTRPKPQ
jgi:hypothetical protein